MFPILLTCNFCFIINIFYVFLHATKLLVLKMFLCFHFWGTWNTFLTQSIILSVTRRSILGSDGMMKSDWSLSLWVLFKYSLSALCVLWVLSECLLNALWFILKSSSNHPEDIMKTSWRHPEDILKSSWTLHEVLMKNLRLKDEDWVL